MTTTTHAPHPDSWMGHRLAGRDPGDVDDWVERWHEGAGATTLPDFLGLTAEEYGNWVLAPSSLPHIVETRKLVEEARTQLLLAVARSLGGMN